MKTAIMNERALRLALSGVPFAGLVPGLVLWAMGQGELAKWCWTAGTIPVAAALTVSMTRDLLAGRVGVDAVALVAMAGALTLDQTLAGVVIAIMYAGGNVLEDFAVARAQRDLKLLIDRSPRVAHRLIDSLIEDVPTDQIVIGDEILVRAGEVIPVDGVLTSQTAIVDESTLTGEPIPVPRQAGEPVRSGSLNAGETLRIRATATASKSTYAGIIRMVGWARGCQRAFFWSARREPANAAGKSGRWRSRCAVLLHLGLRIC